LGEGNRLECKQQTIATRDGAKAARRVQVEVSTGEF